LSQLFEVLNTPVKHGSIISTMTWPNFLRRRRPLQGTPAVSGFQRRHALAPDRCADFSWDAISPAIFGSLFQSVMNPKERRSQGAHYTTERNILKVIGPLFLDELRDDSNA